MTTRIIIDDPWDVTCQPPRLWGTGRGRPPESPMAGTLAIAVAQLGGFPSFEFKWPKK